MCAMTQRGAAVVKAPVVAVSCHHLEDYMSLCLLREQQKSPPNNWVDQHVSIFLHTCTLPSKFKMLQHPKV